MRCREREDLAVVVNLKVEAARMEEDGGAVTVLMRDGTAQVALAVYLRLPWICVCGALQHFPAKRTAGR